ncbi:DUF1961 family protein [Candidatus Poribacteria bacterium]
MKDSKTAEQGFSELNKLDWKQVLSDSGTQDWTKQWFLDGERAIVKNTAEGILFSAGPIEKDNASHAVLWTKESFAGDLKIEFDYTRMDTINKYVNIIYIQATGIGEEPYSKDIAEWSHLRAIPYMSTYFQKMNLLHISFAAFGSEETKKDYVRARRYPVKPDLKFNEIAVLPDNFDTGLFLPGVLYHFTIIKKGHQLYMKVEGDGLSGLFFWDTSGFPPVTEGRIGLRHMWTRCSRYKDFRVSVLQK